MKPARAPRADRAAVRLLVVTRDQITPQTMNDLPQHLRRGDTLVVNDAATLPASLCARDSRGNQVELRLTSQLDESIWQAVVLGAGNWQTPTERRPAPPLLLVGEELIIGEDFHATIMTTNQLSTRLVNLRFNVSGSELWASLYRYGKPVQYSYMEQPLQLWSVQNFYSSRPWAVEMPSAGHALSLELVLELLRNGIGVVSLTHAAGLSSTGDERIDNRLPLAERFDIPSRTNEVIRRTRARGGRVVAVGTSVVRALESARLSLNGIANLKLGAGYERLVVDGLLTGAHETTESHYQLLRAFLRDDTLRRLDRSLEQRGFLKHEFGDMCLILSAITSGAPARALFAQAEV